MKLLSCHIENYGKISDKDFDFNGGLTEFCEQNGYGKTTLASFIKAMFYGLPAYKTNSKDFNDRRKFFPFSGGRFGGNLTFSADGKEYRIERFFDKKSDAGDTLKVYMNGKITDALGDDIGRAVFGLDEQSFSRTVFINGDVLDTGSTGGINAKLNADAQGTVDDGVADNARNRLIAARKRLKADRGGGGEIAEQTERIQKAEWSIKDDEQIALSLGGKYEEANSLKAEIETLNKELEKRRSQKLVLAKWEHYDGERARLKQAEERLKELNTLYGSGLPTDGEIARLKEANTSLTALEGKRSQRLFTDEKRNRLEYLKSKFANGTPDETRIDEMRKKAQDINGAKRKAEILQSAGDEKYLSLAEKFKTLPEESRLAETKARLEDYLKCENRLKYQASAVSAGNSSSAGKGKKYVIAAALCAALIALGIGLLFVVLAAGIAVAAAGAAALLVTGFLYLKANQNRTASYGVNAEAAKIKADMEYSEKAVYEFLTPYGYYSVNGVKYDFAKFEEDLEEYKNLKLKKQADEKTLEELSAYVKALEAEADKFLAFYGIAGNTLEDGLYALKRDKDELEQLLKESASAQDNFSLIEKNIAEERASADGILLKYGIKADGNLGQLADRLLEDAKEYSALVKRIRELKEETENYKAQNNLTDRPENATESEDNLKQTLGEKQRELARIEGQISEDESKVENLADRKDTLELEKEKLVNLKYRYSVLKDALDMLTKAEQNLKDKYVLPVKEKFIHYADLIERTLGEKITMDADFSVKFEREGELREEKHLSAGQRSICALCFRLALIDNMYDREKPFIVMDDPFVNLDEEHMKKTAHLMKELSKEVQIIYFCCHASRVI